VLQVDIDDFYDSGVDDVILKPLSTDKFLFSWKKARDASKYFNNANFRGRRPLQDDRSSKNRAHPLSGKDISSSRQEKSNHK
jgi:hypothetical protein